MRRLALLALFVPSIAAADNDVEPQDRELHRAPDHYIASGLTFGSHAYEFEGVLLEGGMRLSRTPLFLRAMGNGGRVERSDAPGFGSYVEARAGAELRTCSQTGMLCGSVGIDLGLHRSQYRREDLGLDRKPNDPLDETFASAMVVPRLTIDGGNRVRVRGLVELQDHYRETERVKGVAMSLSLGLGF